MATTTTNFGWDVPQSTDLVKDGATAIATLGQDIDTSLVDLKGGTTGQLLSKNSNTDLDYTWVNPSSGDITGVAVTSPLTGGGTGGDVTVGIQSASTTQSGAVQLTDSTSSTSTTTAATPNSVKSAYDLANGAIPKTLTTTTGDIIYASGANTPARLGIGSSGQYLTVSGGIPAWGSVSAGGMTLISTTSLSGSSVALSSIPSTYKDLYLVIYQMTNATSDGKFNFKWNSTGTWFWSGTEGVTAYQNTAGATYTQTGSGPQRVNSDNVFAIRISNYAGSGQKAWNLYGSYYTGAAQVSTNVAGATNGSGAITELNISNTGGSLNGGTALLYGVS